MPPENWNQSCTPSCPAIFKILIKIVFETLLFPENFINVYSLYYGNFLASLMNCNSDTLIDNLHIFIHSQKSS